LQVNLTCPSDAGAPDSGAPDSGAPDSGAPSGNGGRADDDHDDDGGCAIGQPKPSHSDAAIALGLLLVSAALRRAKKTLN
jgi:hypothetical protein